MQFSGLNKIDAILGTQTGIYQAANNVVSYSFVVPEFSGGTNATALTASQQAAVASLLAYVGSVTGVSFVAGAAGAGSTINFCVADLPSNYNGWCEYNGGTSYDIAIDTFGNFAYLSNFAAGSDAYQLLLHEVGHALGLDHSFDGPYSLPAAQDNTSNTVMSYNWSGGARTTYAPFDLLALSWIYGGDGVGGANGIGGTNGPSIPPEAYPPVTHTITANGATVSEAAGQFSFTVTRSGELSVATTVAWAVTGTVDAADFGGTLPSGIVSFSAGETSKTITFSASDDETIESNETVIVTLGARTGQGAVLGDTKSVTYTLIDDDTPPTISIVAAAQGLEGDSGTSEILFTITRSGNIGKTSEILWSFGAGSTTAADFAGSALPVGGKLVFAPGQSSIQLPIAIAGDTQIEGNEEFILNIAATKFGIVGQAQSIGTIISDDVDNTFTVSARAVSIIEGNSGTQSVDFVVTRSGISAASATVSWQRGGSAGSDDTPSPANGVLSFAAGETSKVIHFDVYGDRLIEGDESIVVTLQGVTGLGAGLGPVVQATTMVLSDDPKGAVSVVAAAPSVVEGNAGSQVVHTFTLTRAGELSQAGSMGWTIGGTVDAADFPDGRVPSGTARFAPGQASTNVTVTTAGDTLFEADETLVLTLADGDVVTPDAKNGTATVTILNDDVPNEFRVTAAKLSVIEGSTPGVKTGARFDVVRVGDVSSAATVEWVVAGVGAAPADAADFGTVLPTGKLSFEAGETFKTVFVGIAQDTLAEADEAFALQLRNGVGAGVSSTQGAATVTIVNDDPLPQLALSASNLEVAEGNGGEQALDFEVVRSGDLRVASTVKWELKGAATNGTSAEDFVSSQAFGGAISFAAGESRKWISVRLLGDTQVEANETFTVSLKDATNSIIKAGSASVTVTVLNDDALPRTINGSAASNEKVVLHGLMADYVVGYDTTANAVKLVDSQVGRDGQIMLNNIEVVQFSDRFVQVLPNAAEKALVQLGHAVYGLQGLDPVIYGLGMSYLAKADVASLGEYVAAAFFGGMSPSQMAAEVLTNLQVSAKTLGGSHAEANFEATQALLTSMFTGDSAVRGPALLNVLQVLGTLEGDGTYGQVAAAYNDLVGSEWVAEFAGHAATVVGIPATLVEVPLG